MQGRAQKRALLALLATAGSAHATAQGGCSLTQTACENQASAFSGEAATNTENLKA